MRFFEKKWWWLTFLGHPVHVYTLAVTICFCITQKHMKRIWRRIVAVVRGRIQEFA